MYRRKCIRVISSAATKPLISVVIPTWNRRSLLPRAVESALAQQDVTVEVVIADDGSTDGTAEDWMNCLDPQVKYLSLPHAGACAARNAGVAAAQGEYIAFLDSDDTWRNHKLAVQLERLLASGADAVACAFSRYETDGTITTVPKDGFPEGPLQRGMLLKENFISTQVIFGKASCLKQLQFDPSFPRMQDWDYVLNLTQHFRLDFYRDILADVYVQKDSLSVNTENALTAMRMIFRKYRPDYAASFACTEAVLDAIELFAARSGHSSFRDFCSSLSLPFTVNQKLTLLIRWCKATARGIVKKV